MLYVINTGALNLGLQPAMINSYILDYRRLSMKYLLNVQRDKFSYKFQGSGIFSIGK